MIDKGIPKYMWVQALFYHGVSVARKETCRVVSIIVVLISVLSILPENAEGCGGYFWDESFVPFMNSDAVNYEMLTQKYGIDENSAYLIIDYRDGQDDILGTEDDCYFTDVHQIEEIVGGSQAIMERLEAYAIMWSRGELEEYFTLVQAGVHQQNNRDLSGGIILEGRIVTMNPAEEVFDGKIFIQGNKIVSIVRSDENFPSNIDVSQAIVINTGGTIYPGLIDAHAHLSYHVFPLWEVPKKYTRRYQWQDETKYKQDISRPKNVICDSKMLGLESEANKWGEIKAIVGGTTSIQGGALNHVSVTSLLVRNMEYTCFGQDKIRTRVPAVGDMTSSDVNSLINDMNSDGCDAWYIHLAEGVDSQSLNEFQQLKSFGLLREETVIIHGTALTEQEFAEMAAVGCDLVWSPVSNLLLYGNCTNAAAAAKAGVLVSLGCDWSPSGSKNLLDELKVAWELNKIKFDNYFTPKDLVKQVTINPAKQAHWENFVGSLQPGLYADILVIQGKDTDPYMKLIESTVKDVKLVIVDGDPLYGDVSLMEMLKPGDFEILSRKSGFEKAIDITKNGVIGGTQNVTYLQDILTNALTMNYSWLHTHVKSSTLQAMTLSEFTNYMNTNYPGVHYQPLDPIYVCDDDYFFDTLRNSTNANLSFDIDELYYCWRANSSFSCKDKISGITNGGTVSGIVKITIPNAENKAVYVSVDNGTETRIISSVYIWNTTSLPIGSHFISFRIVDLIEGNVEYTNYSVIVRDTTPPILNIYGITHGKPVAGNVNITTEILDQSRVTLYFSVDDESAIIQNAPGSFLWDSSKYPSGWHVVRFRAVDAFGHATYKNITVDVQDVTPPKFELISPLDQGLVVGEIELIFNATDENSLVYVFLSVDNGPERELLSTVTPFDTKQYSNGIHTLHFRVVDGKGNTQWTNTSIYIDNPTKPEQNEWNEIYSALYFVLFVIVVVVYFLSVFPKMEPKREHKRNIKKVQK